MESINIREARRRLSELVDAASHGTSVRISRRGLDVAQLVPPPQPEPVSLPDLSAFRAALETKGETLSEVVIQQRAAERY